MEACAPNYNPWVGGGLPYSFAMQPQAAATNLVGLAQAFVTLVQDYAKSEHLDGAAEREAIEGVRRAVSHTFVDRFHAANDANCRRKLGLSSWDDEAREIWTDLSKLMATKSGTGLDFTLFFRRLAAPPPALPADGDDDADTGSTALPEALRAVLQPAALQEVDEWPSEHREAWGEWARRYWRRTAAEGRPEDERRMEMDGANPKYILRNWMAAEAYEAAERGDTDVIRELHDVLRRPYDEQSAEAAMRWCQNTPSWARGRPGLAFMS